MKWLKDNAEIVQNALVVSQAVYEEDPIDFLQTSYEKHNLKSVLSSHKDSDCHFLLAEERNDKTVYLSFQGSYDETDVLKDLQFYQKSAENGKFRGKIHAGFLSLAERFPFLKIITSKLLKDKTLVVCGHSLGGAVSSIVTADILLEQERRKFQNLKDVINITFGAPSFGDTELRNFLEEKKISDKMFHLVAENDPIPSLLSFTHSIAAAKSMIDDQIKKLQGNSKFTEKVMELKEKSKKYFEMLKNWTPTIIKLLKVVGLIPVPGLPIATNAIGAGLELVMSDFPIKKNSKDGQEYQPIGNYFFLLQNIIKTFKPKQSDHVYKELMLRQTVNEANISLHSLKYYINTCGENKLFIEDMYTYSSRNVTKIQEFDPKIDKVELVKVCGEEEVTIRLAVEGENLFQTIKSKCKAQFYFPFGNEETILKMSTGDQKERIVFESPMDPGHISIADHGASINIVTIFGEFEGKLEPSNIRNIKRDTVSQVNKVLF